MVAGPTGREGSQLSQRLAGQEGVQGSDGTLFSLSQVSHTPARPAGQ